MHDYAAKEIYAKLKQIESRGGVLSLPADLLAEYYAVNIVYLGKWWLQQGKDIPMPELKRYLRLLFANKDFILPLPDGKGEAEREKSAE